MLEDQLIKTDDYKKKIKKASFSVFSFTFVP